MAAPHRIGGASSQSGQPTPAAVKALQLEYKRIVEEPVEGFRVSLEKDDNLFEWRVAIFGPPGTPYEGGYFVARMRFPFDYPYNPPTVKFVSKIWHPNIYENGDVCISILHPPIDDPQSGELPCERWNPTQNVRTILLSIIALLSEPNTSSPANVDASVMFRKWRASKGADREYETIVRRQVAATKLDAERDGVHVPTTTEEYLAAAKAARVQSQTSEPFNETDYPYDDYEDDYDNDDMDYDEGEDDNEENEEDEDATDECDSQRVAAKKKRIASGGAESNTTGSTNANADEACAASSSKAVTNNNPSTSKCVESQPSTSQSVSLDGVAKKPSRNALGLDDDSGQGQD